MVAGETNLVLRRSFSLLDKMLRFQSCRAPTCVFVLVCFLLSRSSADEQDFMEEFLKQEYSLAKPYRGEATSPVKRTNELTCSYGGGEANEHEQPVLF